MFARTILVMPTGRDVPLKYKAAIAVFICGKCLVQQFERVVIVAMMDEASSENKENAR